MEQLLKILKEKGLSLGSIESMTGGLFASLITSVPGASKVYKGSLVTYQIEEKIRLANVDKNVIDEFGVVSEEVAIEMAEKGRLALNVDLAISVTGNAGPSVESDNKPVGRVYIAISSKEVTSTYEFNFKGDRNTIRKLCVAEMTNCLKLFVSETN